MSSYSLEMELAKKEIAVSNAARDAVDVTEALEMLKAATDSKEISLSLRKVSAMKVLQLIAEDRIGAGDVVKILAMTMDRIDGKVAQGIEGNFNITLETVLKDCRDRSSGLPRDDLPVIDVSAV